MTPDILALRSNLGFWRGEAGDAAGAFAELEMLLPDMLRVLGPGSPRHPENPKQYSVLAHREGDRRRSTRTPTVGTARR